jgi:hypothetical protein
MEFLILMEKDLKGLRCRGCKSRELERLFSTFGMRGGSSDAACSSCSADTCKDCRR